MVALSKLDLADAASLERVRHAATAIKPAAILVDAPYGQVPAALLFPEEAGRPAAPRNPGRRHPATDRFETLSWTPNLRSRCHAYKAPSPSLRPGSPAPKACSRRSSNPATSSSSSCRRSRHAFPFGNASARGRFGR